MTAKTAEKALRELMGGSMNDAESEDHIEIDMSEAVVPGLRDHIRLLPHQVISRRWMKEREDASEKRYGGILADDMGLGKTVQMIVRIVGGPPHKSDIKDGWSGSTLVVCPLALVEQWAAEVKDKAIDMKVVVHHGPKRTNNPAEFRKAHVIVTTYDVVKSEYEAFLSTAKNEGNGKVKSSKSSTLLRPAGISSSDDDSDNHLNRRLATKSSKAAKCALFRVKWWRVALDEAHNIKNHTTKGAVACCALEARMRWCLTGTPMQNSVIELFSLLKFLRIKPLNQIETFKEQIEKPLKSGHGAKRAMQRLQVVLRRVMLRRRKDQTLNGKVLIELPQRNVDIVKCPFDANEQAFYDQLEDKMSDQVKKLMAEQQTGGRNAYISVLLLLLRLRQACDHPSLVSGDYKADLDAIDTKAPSKSQDDDADDLVAAFGQLGVAKKCAICMTELTADNVDRLDNTHCSGCEVIVHVRSAGDRPSSAKIRTILKLLRDTEKRSNGEEKTIIFSQFTSMLNLIEPFLREEGISFVRYDGSMSRDMREESLRKIREKESIRVILISFKAGSTGLNLTACNNVILVDLWWNPALEEQAFDRTHRYGQKRDVNIHKLTIEGTVEDRILALQERKRELARAALSGDKVKMNLGMDDLLALFRPGAHDDDEEED
ncbi:hypothetical protein FISHEDRAFT_40909 [Fistulina hepatica ATCC 64428]|uniref:Uncharacterized protein n=1 Tax=Fistulina hepatica ATCC 64428 TaxID=1128425 RepID=A0A0D7AEQ7_9AGAR|nr:hypothetical protein FISHEDRAFT_40909 [Fistulina hepatica ATCC 64428]